MSIIIQPSPIHGMGVFAARRFQAGETIIDWRTCAELLTDEQVAGLAVDERRFLSFIEGRPVLFKPPARFVNHSCEPNARGELGRDVATRDIEIGEEVTVDYVVEQVPDLDLHCGCGASRCRGELKPTSA